MNAGVWIAALVFGVAAAVGCGASGEERGGTTTLTSGINPTEGTAEREAPPPGVVYVPGGSKMTSAPSAKTGDDNAPTAPADVGPRQPLQGTSRLELDTTASIHESLMADKTLSAEAQHVVVATSGSNVTLEGTVRDAGEKRHVLAIAQEAPGVASVTDKLAVKTP